MADTKLLRAGRQTDGRTDEKLQAGKQTDGLFIASAGNGSRDLLLCSLECYLLAIDLNEQID